MTKLRKYIAMLLIVCMCTNTFANAASTSYAVQALAYQAGEVLVRAAKNGVTKGLAVRPRPSTVAKGVAGGLGATLVASIIADKLGEGIDWIIDPANNTIKYNTVPDTLANCPPVNPMPNRSEYVFDRSYRAHKIVGDDKIFFTRCVYVYNGFTSVYDIYDAAEQTLSLDEVSQDIIDRARAGDKNAQNVVEQSVKAGFNHGIYDNALDDAKPFDEAGYETYTPETPVDVDLSGVAAAIAAMQSAISGLQGALVDGMTDIKTSINDLIDGQSAINDAIDAQTTDVVDAIDAQTTDIDESIKVGVSDVVDSIDAQTTDITDAVNAGTSDVVDAIDAQTTDIDDSIKVGVSDVVDSIDAQTGTITDAVGAQTDAITETDTVTGDSVLSLPTFCGWASVVCEFITWATADPDLPDDDESLPAITDLTDIDEIDISKNYVTASGQCPSPEKLAVMGGTVELSYSPLCTFLEKLSGIIVACSYLTSAYMIMRVI